MVYLRFCCIAERVLHLEADLRRSEVTIQSLQQELAITKLAQTPTTDTHRYQLGAGHGGVVSSPLELSSLPKSMKEVAVTISETAVAKGVKCPLHLCMYVRVVLCITYT